MNLKMPALKACLESAGFTQVKTVLSSGNVVFTAKAGSEASLERKIETAMTTELDRVFYTIVRSLDSLDALLEADPYQAFRLPAGSKRVVTFMRKAPSPAPELPGALHGARIWSLEGKEAYSAYVPGPKGPVFMSLLEKTLGTDITTRTWDTVAKVAKLR
jgi:uncharacterized protein (DUF1697 family)